MARGDTLGNPQYVEQVAGGSSVTPPSSSQLPASLGAKTGANSLSVVPATDAPFPVTRYDATPATRTTGDIGPAQVNARGQLYSIIRGDDNGFIAGVILSGATISLTAQASVQVSSVTYGYDGANGVRIPGDTKGLVTQPHALSGNRWSYAAATGGISNTNTAVTFKAADATLRNYVTGIQLFATALGAATEIAIRDGAGGTVLWRGVIGTAGLPNGLSIDFDAPLKGTAATLLEVVTLTASVTGAVYFNAQGFVGA